MTMRKGLPAKLALTDADDTRYDFLNDVVCNADGTPRGGITSPVATSLVTGRADMLVNVGRFAAVAPRDGGAIKLANDGTITVTIPNAPASGTRTHVVAARQDDASSTVTVPDADNLAKVYVIQDTGSGQPALPDGSVLLATVAISAGQVTTNATTITQATQYTASAGAAVPFRTDTQLKAWTTAREGQLAWAVDTFSLYVRSGAAWLYTREAGALSGLVKRSATTGAFDAVTYANLSANAFWTAVVAKGITYNNGWTIARAGRYRVDYSVSTYSGTGLLVGLTVNNTSPTYSDLRGRLSATAVQSVVGATASAELDLAVGDVVRLFALAASGTPAWAASDPSGIFAITFIDG